MILGPQTHRERDRASLKRVWGGGSGNQTMVALKRDLMQKVGIFRDVHCNTIYESERLDKFVYSSAGELLKKGETN